MNNRTILIFYVNILRFEFCNANELQEYTAIPLIGV